MSGCWPVPLVGRKTAEGEIESATIKERHSDAEKVKRMLKPSMSFQNLGMTEIRSCTSSGRANSGPIIQAGQLRPGQLRPVPIQACPNSGRAVLTQAGAISGPSQFRPSCPNSGRCHFRPIPIQANPIPSQANLSQFRSILYQA